MFVSLFLRCGLSLGTLVFALGEQCGGGPCPSGDQRSSRWGPQLPPRRVARGQPYLSISALQSYHELRVVLVRLLGQLKGFPDLQQLPFGSHGQEWLRHQPLTAPRARRQRPRRPRAQLQTPRGSGSRSREKAGRARARACALRRGGRWRPAGGSARGAAPLLPSQEDSDIFSSKL